MNDRFEAMRMHFAGKTAALIGMGISNRAATDFLLSMGLKLTARDKNPKPTEELSAFLSSRGIKGIFGDGYLDDLNEDILVRSPGVPLTEPALHAAKERGVEITSEMEIFLSLCPATVFAVTGSDGKTTTTTLISKMLEAQASRDGAHVFLGGNIGTPLLPQVSEMTEKDYAVLELSSFQLYEMPASPRVAVVTNVTPNHLNWHRDMAEYIACKKNVFMGQTAECRLVLNFEKEITCKMAEEAKGSVTFFSSKRRTDGTVCYFENGVIYYDDGEKTAVMKKEDILLPGLHNVENYMAAISAVHGFVPVSDMVAVARTFGGVPHRIELVGEKDGVRYYNSSIDTSPTRTLAALASFTEKLIVIVGGYDKHIPIEPLISPLADKARFVVATGDTGLSVLEALRKQGYPKEQMAYLGHFDEAVRFALSHAKSGDTVLLSPAAASFDSFQSFEKRGERFRALVNEFLT